MKQLTLKDIQQVSLDVLQEIHSFCVENNIRYGLAYGTLIGAVRHKGFIPWDDDIDIIMPRPDYERFCKTYKSTKTKLFSKETGNCYFNYARVCDMVNTYVDVHTIFAPEPVGVWIDIFPVDGIAETREEFLRKAADIRNISKKLFEARGARDKINPSRPLMYNLKKIAKKIIFRHYNIAKIQDEYSSILNFVDFDTSEHSAMIWCPYNVETEYIPTEYYKEYEDIEFCGYKFKTVSAYDKLLRCFYGDYMQLPPEKDRVPKHSEHIYYWKNK